MRTWRRGDAGSVVRRVRADSGSVLLLQVLCVVVVVAVVGAICDVGAVLGARRQLSATADQAAVAGAQAVDLGSYYVQGADREGVALHPEAVEGSVRRYLAPSIAAQEPQGIALAGVQVDADGVSIQLQARATLPFASLVGIETVPVSASARAALYVEADG